MVAIWGRAVGDAQAEWFEAIEPGQRSTFTTPGEPGTNNGPGALSLFVYDRFAGGVGLSERLFDERLELLQRALGMLERCDCPSGCPRCIGPNQGREAKHVATRMLRALTDELLAITPRVAQAS
jgi:ATP-dependent helicase YprA (DUF1998 family)